MSRYYDVSQLLLNLSVIEISKYLIYRVGMCVFVCVVDRKEADEHFLIMYRLNEVSFVIKVVQTLLKTVK